MEELWTIKLEQEFNLFLEEYKTSINWITYQNLVEKLKTNEKVKNLLEEVRTIQKELVKIEHEEKDTLPLTKRYQEKIDELEEIPLYTSYKEAQKRVNNDLQEIKESLEIVINQAIL